MSDKKKLNDEELVNIAGGSDSEPEEFDWRTKGYPTPVKDQTSKSGWRFEAIGDVTGFFKKIIHKGDESDN